MAKIEKPNGGFEFEPNNSLDNKEVLDQDRTKDWKKMADWMSLYKGNPETMPQDLDETSEPDNNRMKFWLDKANEKQS